MLELKRNMSAIKLKKGKKKQVEKNYLFEISYENHVM
jgi:hypothetical protein